MRPLLAMRRQALLDYLHARQIPYRVDSSNRDPRFTRNRLRLELLPMLEANFNPAVVDVLCRLADQAQELSVEIATRADTLRREAELPRAGATLIFSLAPLQKASANLVREMFRLVWQREGWPMGGMDFERWNWLVEIVQEARPACDFPGKIHVRRFGGIVQISHQPDA
jgi:tRNA(Ile)-lysidine synthase